MEFSSSEYWTDTKLSRLRWMPQRGNVFCTGPGGVWVCRPTGALLGRLLLPELPANLAWGEDGSVLFLTARTSVYRLPTTTRGALLG
jgi:gluconolactonase